MSNVIHGPETGSGERKTLHSTPDPDTPIHSAQGFGVVESLSLFAPVSAWPILVAVHSYRRAFNLEGPTGGSAAVK